MNQFPKKGRVSIKISPYRQRQRMSGGKRKQEAQSNQRHRQFQIVSTKKNDVLEMKGSNRTNNNNIFYQSLSKRIRTSFVCQ